MLFLRTLENESRSPGQILSELIYCIEVQFCSGFEIFCTYLRFSIAVAPSTNREAITLSADVAEKFKARIIFIWNHLKFLSKLYGQIKRNGDNAFGNKWWAHHGLYISVEKVMSTDMVAWSSAWRVGLVILGSLGDSNSFTGKPLFLCAWNFIPLLSTGLFQERIVCL